MGSSLQNKQNCLIAITVLTVMATVMSTGCSSNSKSSFEKTAGASMPLKTVTVRLSWLGSSEYAGLIAAVDQGFYAKEGLNVKLESGGVGMNSIALVAGGADDIGLAGGDSLLLARSRGVPVRAFATDFQISPQVFFARKSSGITSPADFPGHRVGIKTGKTAETLLYAMMGKAGVSMANVNTVPVTADIRPFLAGKVDVWPGFIFDEAAEAKAHGIDINIIEPAKYGITFYADALFATDKTLKQRPEMIRRFLKATCAGWMWAEAHPNDALKLTLKAYPGLDPKHEAIRLKGTLKRVIVTENGKAIPIGSMNPTIWKNTYNILQQQKLLKSSFNVDDAYTMEFVK